MIPAIFNQDTSQVCYPAVLMSSSAVNNDYTFWRDLYLNSTNGVAFGIIINGVDYSLIYRDLYDFSAVLSMDDVAQNIQDVLNTNDNIVTVVFDNFTNKFIITTIQVGPTASLHSVITDYGGYALLEFEMQTIDQEVFGYCSYNS